MTSLVPSPFQSRNAAEENHNASEGDRLPLASDLLNQSHASDTTTATNASTTLHIFEDGGSESDGGRSGGTGSSLHLEDDHGLATTLSFDLPSDTSRDGGDDESMYQAFLLPLALTPPHGFTTKSGGNRTTTTRRIVTPDDDDEDPTLSRPKDNRHETPRLLLAAPPRSIVGRWHYSRPTRRSTKTTVELLRSDAWDTELWDTLEANEDDDTTVLASGGSSSSLSLRSPVRSAVVARILQHQHVTDAAQIQRRINLWQQDRMTADEMVQALSLSNDENDQYPKAESCLQALRNKAGAVEVIPEDDPASLQNPTFGFVPYLHLQDDVWVPHYEAYVIHQVKALRDFLQSPPSSSSSPTHVSPSSTPKKASSSVSHKPQSSPSSSPPPLTFVSLLLMIVATTTTVTLADPDHWYTRYPAYHPYCSNRQEMQTRGIPDIREDARYGASQLLHTTVVVRHGARTPWTALDCWEGYTSAWDCNLTTYLATPPPQRIAQEEGYVSPDSEQSSVVLFEKRYDALSDATGNPMISNVLNGTCQQGQLILQGYEQELQNGQALRHAYVYDSSGQTPHNARMKLLDIRSASVDALMFDQLYYRVDDDQRTLMSGQIVLRGLLGPELIDYWEQNNGKHPVLPLHTADRPRDVLGPNEKTCERLQEMNERYRKSPEYQTFLKSNETLHLQDFYKTNLGRDLNDTYPDVLDCLMTTMCTDRELPHALNDYNPGNMSSTSSGSGAAAGNYSNSSGTHDGGGNYFERLYQFGKSPLALLYQANNAEYSKLAMSPLWAEIMSHIYAITGEPTNDCCPPLKGPPAKLALYAGHDTTLMPLLASLGPGVWDSEWPPYASMMALEIHQVHLSPDTTDKVLYRSNYAFRLLFNGQVLTHRVSGCAPDAELCDIQLLIKQVRPFATRHTDCRRKYPAHSNHEDTVALLQKAVASTEGILSVVVILVSTFLAGMVTACFCVVRRSRRLRRPKRQIKVATEEDQSNLSLTDNGVETPGSEMGTAVVAEEGSGYEDNPERYGSIT